MEDLQWIRNETFPDYVQLQDTKESFSYDHCRKDLTGRNLYALLYAVDVFHNVPQSLCDFVQDKKPGVICIF